MPHVNALILTYALVCVYGARIVNEYPYRTAVRSHMLLPHRLPPATVTNECNSDPRYQNHLQHKHQWVPQTGEMVATSITGQPAPQGYVYVVSPENHGRLLETPSGMAAPCVLLMKSGVYVQTVKVKPQPPKCGNFKVPSPRGCSCNARKHNELQHRYQWVPQPGELVPTNINGQPAPPGEVFVVSPLNQGRLMVAPTGVVAPCILAKKRGKYIPGVKVKPQTPKCGPFKIPGGRGCSCSIRVQRELQHKYQWVPQPHELVPTNINGQPAPPGHVFVVSPLNQGRLMVGPTGVVAPCVLGKSRGVYIAGVKVKPGDPKPVKPPPAPRPTVEETPEEVHPGKDEDTEKEVVDDEKEENAEKEEEEDEHEDALPTFDLSDLKDLDDDEYEEEEVDLKDMDDEEDDYEEDEEDDFGEQIVSDEVEDADNE